MNDSYHLQFEKLCEKLGLGELTTTPKPISGGLLHRVFAIKTTTGRYAVKALNPKIMARPAALNNYIEAERVVSILSKRISAQPANVYGDTFLQEIDHQFYMVFDWIEGRSLKPFEITDVHCRKVGFILAEIHQTKFAQVDSIRRTRNDENQIPWKFYLHKGIAEGAVWANHLSNRIEQLSFWTEQINRSVMLLEDEQVFSHRDLEPKNVMWVQDNPIVIDWESAGEINPKHDLIETAIYWSIDESGKVNKCKFDAFLSGYQQLYGDLEADWKTVLVLGYSSKLNWLEYSLKRSLWIECTDAIEQEMGTVQVMHTLNALEEYQNMTIMLESWLHDKNEDKHGDEKFIE
ncbi:aminoglycoside phosphotransferase family protein [Paenibacillus sp. FSL R7-0652]|uniref:Aminoglycoside phosphotransferase family protein n=1 Tax=Paenibacillus sp. AN1007 TaxID=3151385 RepID=A0AAU8NLH4_9BACL